MAKQPNFSHKVWLNEIKMKLTIALLIGVVIGAISYRTWDAHTATARHWRAVREYSAYMRNPENYKPTGNGFTMAHDPFDPLPHLAALVAEGELIHDDIVLPSVPYPNREATKHWRTFCERHLEEIVYAYGECDPGPHHLNFWFTEAGKPLIQQLIEELKEIGSKEEPTPNSSVRGIPRR